MLTKLIKYCLLAGVINFIAFTTCIAEEIALPRYGSQPKEMVIYESGFAIVKDIVKIDAQDMVQVELPRETILRTLVILDGGKRVKSFNSSNVDNFPPPSIMYEKTTKSPICEKMPITSSILTPQKNTVDLTPLNCTKV